MSDVIHQLAIRVSFGDCDPAGIAYYPTILGWFDRTFHDWLWQYGGHGALCESYGAMGIGVIETSARFLRPLRNGDHLTIDLAIAEWQRKSLTLTYALRTGPDLAVSGHEVRGLFVQAEAGMIAAPLQPIRKILESHDQHP